ncbi:ribonuclease II [Prochlorococcus marinus str. MU1404]|uniref:ribonuclease catalytic domain-containing protein n=1 Tax=Prochlorococcus marinus TaxID=1219 RepID=UPI001ADB3EF0|nr:ribonuclease catalytic domain-containing protein [Prochlorococcus marinus]MBO8230032.1 RNB domain-containing ribonuclease [Prochlorococcus marinus XMU1404]MBW3073194.1 ribonuclease II [Prochlorococcus marinus str. MU1404]MCR8545631.1 ribonuclease catalytic domain-containing protein [Prochlorococcus marinus CUG1432]
MRDLTNLKTYIIDSEDPHEVDDAISLEIKDGNVKNLWIHISNPCKLFLQDSNIDLDARKNNSSLYLIDQYVPMLPIEIIDKANLAQNKISETISAVIEFNEDGSIDNYEIIEAIIKPKYQLTYEDVNEILELEPKEEIELVEIKNLLEKSIIFRKKQGAIIIESPNSKINKCKDKIIINKIEKTIAQIIVAEAMILMGYVTSLFLKKSNLAAAYRSQKINCNPFEILNKYKDSEIKYILLKQHMGKSYITTKPNSHESLGLPLYVQCTSPLRRYLDLIMQRQVYNKINNLENISNNSISKLIDYSRNRQIENNNIYKNNKFKYLSVFFKIENKTFYKIIFVKWINYKRNIALVYFPEYSLEIIITLFVSIDLYINKIYKVKFNISDNNLLEFIY